MNTAKLTTTSGHTWTTSINGTHEEVTDYFLGKYFPVGSFDEHAPNEGFTQQKISLVETFNQDGESIGCARIEADGHTTERKTK